MFSSLHGTRPPKHGTCAIWTVFRLLRTVTRGIAIVLIYLLIYLGYLLFNAKLQINQFSPGPLLAFSSTVRLQETDQ